MSGSAGQQMLAKGLTPAGAASYGWLGPPPGQPDGMFRRATGMDLRGHRHVRGHLLIFTDAKSARGRCVRVVGFAHFTNYFLMVESTLSEANQISYQCLMR